MDSNGHAIFHGGQYGNGAGTAGFVPREPKSMDSVTAAAVAAAAGGGSGAGAAAGGGGGGGGAECVNSFGNMEVLLSVAAATGHTTSATASASGTSNSRYNSHGHRLENNSTHHSHGHAHGHNLQHASSFISGSDASFKLDGCFRRPAVAAQVQPKNNNTDEEAALRAGSWHQQQQQQQQHRQHDTNMETLKSRIASHPRYPQLMAAFMDCSKIGASPEVAALMEQKLQHCKSLVPSTSNSSCAAPGASDPELDLFMNDYCELLIRYEAELSGPYKEAMEFVHKMQVELHSLGGMDIEANSPGAAAAAHGAEENGGNTSEEEEELNCNFMETTAPDSNNHSAESKELKEKLLRKYSGCFGNLRKEFLKKKKKGKLPKNARQKLLDWWDAHYKWPYPCELDKAALAESTGLDQKQINNWFINQRKRHWKPSEDMQLVILDSMNPHASYTVGTAAMEW